MTKKIYLETFKKVSWVALFPTTYIKFGNFESRRENWLNLFRIEFYHVFFAFFKLANWTWF